MKRVKPELLVTVGEVMDFLATCNPKSPVVVESATVYPDSYDGVREGAETDCLDLHRVTGFYRTSDTPIGADERAAYINKHGAVLSVLRNTSLSIDTTSVGGLVEQIEDDQ